MEEQEVSESGRGRKPRRLGGLLLLLVLIVAGKVLLSVGGNMPAWAATRGVGETGALDRSAPDRGRSQVQDLVEALQQRQAELALRAESLEEREEAMLVFERELENRVAELEGIRRELDTRVGAAETASTAAAEEISRVYAAMKPADAAPILDGLEDEVVLRILRQMRAKQVSAILPLLDRERAVVLTRALAG